MSRLELFFFVRCHLVLCPVHAFLSPSRSLFSLPSPLSPLVTSSVRSVCVSGVIGSVPFGLNVTRSAHRWRRHRWLLVLCSLGDCAVTAVLLCCLAVVIVSISFLDIFSLELLVVSCSACLLLCCLLLPLGLLSLLDLALLTPLLCCFPSCAPRPYLFACLLELYLTVDGLLRMLLQFVAVHQACQGCPVDRHANSILLRTRLISWLSRTLFRIIQQCYLFFSSQSFDHCLACSQLSRCFSTPPSLYRIKQSISSPLLR